MNKPQSGFSDRIRLLYSIVRVCGLGDFKGSVEIANRYYPVPDFDEIFIALLLFNIRTTG
jgi:hypothetical protein